LALIVLIVAAGIAAGVAAGITAGIVRRHLGETIKKRKKETSTWLSREKERVGNLFVRD